ncbi:hypothetical protein OG588_22385 [Streptomyces prunicolor]|uniref:hypothetical protein n=1 Tax=Streptomyces prunicolor TaxID=67348 RepID=UPI00386E8C36|nr:hypothetical protein OG588_22385 [Streptomyces prunicolor]
MSESSLSGAFDSLSSKALCCATALRLGGGLYILADAAEKGDLYYQVDAGVRAGLRACEGRRLNADVMRIAIKASRRLESEYTDQSQAIQFAQSGFRLLADVLEVIAADEAEVSDAHIEIFTKALSTTESWPASVDLSGFSHLPDFERFCQQESIDSLRTGGVAEVRDSLGRRELDYRGIARRFRQR